MTRKADSIHDTCFDVQVEEAGRRLDRVLLSRFPDLSRSALATVIAAGQVRVNGRSVAKGTPLRAGDKVTLQGPTSLAALPDASVPLCIGHLDDHLLIVDKPAGMPCHGLLPGELGTLAAALLARFPELASVGNDPREPGLVHRLDTDTSGLLLVARDTPTFVALRAMLKAGQLDKTYVARCAPTALASPLTVGLHHAFLRADRGAHVRVNDHELGDRSRAITTEVLRATPLKDNTWLVRVRIHRAARHQVRAHLAQLGYPLVGDALYGGPPDSQRHLLHADNLHFVHPMYGSVVEATADIPEAVLGVLPQR